MFGITDKALSVYFKLRQRKIERIIADPIAYQKRLLSRILKMNAACEYGKLHSFSRITEAEEFSRAVPIREYESLSPYIRRMMEGESGILCTDRIDWFAKSSGTSTGRSKYIPVSREYLQRGHLKCAWDAASFIYNEDSRARLFADKSLIMGGSYEKLASGKFTGDISAIIIKHFPPIGKAFYTPDFETALMSDWDEKIQRMASICSKEDVTLIAGVPSWLMVLFDEILKKTGFDNMSEVWPHARSFLHGGVSFEPYQEQFKAYLPTNDIRYREVYNASEGYFAIQNESEQEGMLLLADNEVYFEFQEWNGDPDSKMECVEWKDLEIAKPYALIITNSSGLYRYKLGDLVELVSKFPFKIKVVGRTRSMINVFGEELSIANTDQALMLTCRKHNAIMNEYTVGPVFLDQGKKGAHEWLIEFRKPPVEMGEFAVDLDRELRRINSDYDAKRSGDLALRSLIIKELPKRSFEYWMRNNSKYGGQNKVPRLRNDRKIIEEVLDCIHTLN